jgi:glutamyl-tRNA reductase
VSEEREERKRQDEEAIQKQYAQFVTEYEQATLDLQAAETRQTAAFMRMNNLSNLLKTIGLKPDEIRPCRLRYKENGRAYLCE